MRPLRRPLLENVYLLKESLWYLITGSLSVARFCFFKESLKRRQLQDK